MRKTGLVWIDNLSQVYIEAHFLISVVWLFASVDVERVWASKSRIKLYCSELQQVIDDGLGRTAQTKAASQMSTVLIPLKPAYMQGAHCTHIFVLKLLYQKTWLKLIAGAPSSAQCRTHPIFLFLNLKSSILKKLLGQHSLVLGPRFLKAESTV
ncbi:hypothetical protein NDU88_001297 [Pleurodeles waltl]|uniref:Uncharacterized protein n=1 Tax=Pleurodeles waltl TaxID=8319 RepID=A0AAV7THE8_PLEWA|nr:hypothetical protein NDU88_001297 [Pleurodeles waltl]